MLGYSQLHTKTLPFFSHQRLREENWAKPKEAVSPPLQQSLTQEKKSFSVCCQASERNSLFKRLHTNRLRTQQTSSLLLLVPGKLFSSSLYWSLQVLREVDVKDLMGLGTWFKHLTVQTLSNTNNELFHGPYLNLNFNAVIFFSCYMHHMKNAQSLKHEPDTDNKKAVWCCSLLALLCGHCWLCFWELLPRLAWDSEGQRRTGHRLQDELWSVFGSKIKKKEE